MLLTEGYEKQETHTLKKKNTTTQFVKGIGMSSQKGIRGHESQMAKG